MAGGLALGSYIGYLVAYDRFAPALYLSAAAAVVGVVGEVVAGIILFTYARFTVVER
jgi:hypothetical protein